MPCRAVLSLCLLLLAGCSGGDEPVFPKEFVRAPGKNFAAGRPGAPGSDSPGDAAGSGGSAAEKDSADDTPASADSTAGRPKIGVSLLTFQNPFFKTIADHIALEAEKHGYDVIALSAEEDVAKQSHQVKDFIVQRVAAIVLSPCESRSIVPVIQEANAAGIPVFTVDIPCKEPGVKIVSQIATDNYGGGREAAKAVAEALTPTGGKVVIIHYKQAESCRLRVAGFRDEVEEYNKSCPDAPIEIIAELEGGGAREIGNKAAEDALQAHPEIDAFFAINDPSALGVVAALERTERLDEIIVVGFDGQPDGKQAIKEGKLYADPIQFPDQMGIRAVQSIVAYSNGEDVPADQPIPTKLYRKADADQDPSLQ